MAGSSPANKSVKRAQVSKDQANILIILGVASVITISSLVVAKGFLSRGNYLAEVSSIKGTALQQLQENEAATASLVTKYQEFVEEDPNLLGGSIDGESDKDGDNGELVLDALPSKYDFPAVAASLEKLLTGYAISGIVGTDESAAQAAAAGSGPVEIPFILSVTTNYIDFRDLVSSFNRSIRPIQVTRLELSGTNGNLDVSIAGKTFYQPETSVKITKETVR